MEINTNSKIPDNYILLSEDDFRSIGEGHPCYWFDEMEVEIAKDFIIKLLFTDEYYNQLIQFLKSNNSTFRLVKIDSDNVLSSYGWGDAFLKQRLLEVLNEIYSSSFLKKEGIEKCAALLEIAYNSFLESYDKTKYSDVINNVKYEIDISKINEIMDLSDKEFYNFCTNDENKIINGISREEFFYLVSKYFKSIEQLITFPPKISEKLKKINYFSLVDFEAFDILNQTEESDYKKVNLNNELKKLILENMPEDLIDIEKAIYIYIKMCKLLNYDDEYFIFEQEGSVAEKHRDISYIENITLKNLKVTCFEFNIIFARLLSEIGINFKNRFFYNAIEKYGFDHVCLFFKSGKYLVNADAVTSIFEGDLVNAKLNQPLVGLNCVNKNKQTKDEFRKIVEKIYKIIAKEENKEADINHTQTFDELLAEYSMCTNNVKPISLEERFSIFVNKISTTNIEGMAFFAYLLQLKRILFEKTENLKIEIIRNHDNEDSNKVTPIAIISFNKNIFNNGNEETIEEVEYFSLVPNLPLKKISKEELQKYFDDLKYQFVGNHRMIPGIKNRR